MTNARGCRRFLVDEHLVERALAGSDEAWCEIYFQIRSFVMGLCLSRFNLSWHDSEDAFQNIMTQFSRSVDRIEDYGAWLYGAARRQAAMIRKSNSTQSSLNTVVTDHTPSIEESIAFWMAYDKLSDLCKELIKYLYLYRYTQREASTYMNIPDGSVNYVKNRCREQFTFYFTGENP